MSGRIRWTALGFRLGAVARARGRPDMEGRIVRHIPPRGPDEGPLIQVHTWKGCKLFLSLAACEVRGIDYEA